jgi:hypothetical protein
MNTLIRSEPLTIQALPQNLSAGYQPFSTWSHNIAQTDLELSVLLLQPPKNGTSHHKSWKLSLRGVKWEIGDTEIALSIIIIILKCWKQER